MSRFTHLAGKLGVGETLAGDIGGQPLEPIRVLERLLAVIVAKHLLIEVTEKMERFHADIGSIYPPLQEAPEVLDSVGVDVSVDVGFGVVDHHVDVGFSQATVGPERIGIDHGTSGDVVLGVLLQRLLLASLNDGSAEFSTTLQDTDNGGLVLSASSGDPNGPLTLVHIPGCAADESFVNFDFGSATAHLDERTGLHGEANAMEHEPCGFLSDTESAAYLVGANPVFAIGDHPDSDKPFVQADGGILEDGPDLDAELLAGMLLLALPYVPGCDEANVLAPTGWALYASRPTQ